jgi:hypothetical protein
MYKKQSELDFSTGSPPSPTGISAAESDGLIVRLINLLRGASYNEGDQRIHSLHSSAG